MPQVIIIIAQIGWGIVAALFLGGFIKGVIRGFREKSVMLYGPRKSGKTTFLSWLKDGKPIPKGEYIQDGASEEYYQYRDDENDIDYDILNKGGAQEFLVNKGQSLFKKNDIILVFFNIAKYITEQAYSVEVNALFDGIAAWYKDDNKPVLIIGTHKDELTPQQQEKCKSNLVTIIDPTKDYYQFLCGREFVLVDMYEKSDVTLLLKQIKKLVK